MIKNFSGTLRLLGRIREAISYIFSPFPASMARLDYGEYWRRRGPYEFSTRYAAFAEAVEEGASVLDIGCGEGATLRYLLEARKVRGEGIDISPKGVEMARASGVQASVADASAADFRPARTYDHIIISEVLEHIPNPEELLLNVRDFFGKSLIVSIPNTGHYLYRLRLLFGRFPVQWQMHPGEHLRFWTIKDFFLWLEPLGLHVSEVKIHSGFTGLCRLWPNLFADSAVFVIRRKP